MADKQFQIVVLGASGFVGKLVAKHLAQDYMVSQPLEKQLLNLCCPATVLLLFCINA